MIALTVAATEGGRRDLSRGLNERKSACLTIQRSRHRSVRDFPGMPGRRGRAESRNAGRQPLP
jgi:hypothetical protein